MKRFLPKTLTSQTILVLLIGLTVSHLFSMLIYSGDREEALAMLGGRNMAQRIANVAHLVADSPPSGRKKSSKTSTNRISGFGSLRKACSYRRRAKESGSRHCVLI